MRSKSASPWDRKRVIEDRQLLDESRSRTRNSKSHLKDMITASKLAREQITKSKEALVELRKNKKDRPDEVPNHHLIAYFMSASAPLEEYLRKGKPLTPHEIELISLTISGLQTFINVWKRKNRVPFK